MKKSTLKLDLVNDWRQSDWKLITEYLHQHNTVLEHGSGCAPIVAMVRVSQVGNTVALVSEWIPDNIGSELAAVILRCVDISICSYGKGDRTGIFRLSIIPSADSVIYHVEETPKRLPTVLRLFPEYTATDGERVFLGVPSDRPFERYNAAWLSRFHLLCGYEQVGYSLVYCEASRQWYFVSDDFGPTKDHSALPHACDYYVKQIINRELECNNVQHS